MKQSNGREKELTSRELAKARWQAAQLEKRLADQIMSSVQVICATCIGAGNPCLAQLPFPIVILDGAWGSYYLAITIRLIHSFIHSFTYLI